MQRYRDFAQKLTANDGSVVQSGLSFVDVIYSGKTVFHTVTAEEEGRPDLIVWKWLKDWTLWPYVCWYNGIFDPIADIKAGMELVIPVQNSFVVKPFTYPQEK